MPQWACASDLTCNQQTSRRQEHGHARSAALGAKSAPVDILVFAGMLIVHAVSSEAAHTRNKPTFAYQHLQTLRARAFASWVLTAAGKKQSASPAE